MANNSALPSRFYENATVKWIEHRLPIFSFVDHSLGSQYPAPKNLSYWWNFGALAGLMLVVMIVSGIVLAMQYTPHTLYAFDSVERNRARPMAADYMSSASRPARIVRLPASLF